jgi:arsenite methyltransferase
MSRSNSTSSEQLIPVPDWLGQYLGVELPDEGEAVMIAGHRYVMQRGILRDEESASDDQEQTAEAFGFKWQKRDTFESDASLERMKSWLIERYGPVAEADWWGDYGETPLVLDAGCGASMSALELLRPALPRLRYIGADISAAVDVAAARFAELGLPAAFLQADLTNLPFPEGSLDVIFSEGVLHHTDSTENALKRLATLLRPDGRFLFYVYRRKGPIREFTDDYVRERLPEDPDEAWRVMEPLTRLGIALGELDAEIEVPEDVELLDIPAGKMTVQRLFYWHVFKAFYREDLSVEEMNHINYDWFAPANAHRQSPEEVRSWCADAGLEIEHENVEPAGITVIARKK